MSHTETLLSKLLSEPLSLDTVISDGVTQKSGPKIVQLCWTDSGGAGIAAYRLHKGLCQIGADSTLLVLFKKNVDPTVRVIPALYNGVTPARPDNCRESAKIVNDNFHRWQTLLTKYPNVPPDADLFSDTSSDIALHFVKEIEEADIINMHWVAGVVNYAELPRALGEKPVVWTFHDQNPFTGGCHYSRDCTRYTNACGHCPNLGSTTEKDITWHMHRQKKLAVENLPITVVTPSKWLGEISATSSIMGGFPHHVIPNGQPSDIFRPWDKKESRSSFGIPEDKVVLLFGAAAPHIHRKGLPFLLKALEQMAAKRDCSDVALAIYGELAPGITFPSSMNVYPLGRIDDQSRLARAYSAANAFVIPTLEDNLPNTIIESLSCGCPVIGFQTGGVPDMIQHEKNGFLVAQKDVAGLVAGIEWAASLGNRAEEVSRFCRDDAVAKYDQKIQATSYYNLYQRILKERDAAEVLVAKGEDAFGDGEKEKARALFEKAVKGYPYLSRAYNNIGAMQWQNGDAVASAASFTKALGIKPDCRTALLNLGDLVASHEDADTFLAFARFYLDGAPDDDEILNLLIANQKIVIDSLLQSTTITGEVGPAPAEVSAIVIANSRTGSDGVRDTLNDLAEQRVRMDAIVVDPQSCLNGASLPSTAAPNMNVRMCIPQRPVRYADALNMGVRLAQAELIFSVTGGDRLAPDCCSMLQDPFVDNTNVFVTCGDTRVVNEITTSFVDCAPDSCLNVCWRATTPRVLLQMQGGGPHAMWRKNLHDTIGYFDTRYNQGATQDFWVRAARIEPLVHVPSFTGLIVGSDDRVFPQQKQLSFIRKKYAPFVEAPFQSMDDLFGGVMAASAFIADLANFVEQGQNKAALELYDQRRRDFSPSPDLEKVDQLMEEVRQRTRR